MVYNPGFNSWFYKIFIYFQTCSFLPNIPFRPTALSLFWLQLPPPPPPPLFPPRSSLHHVPIFLSLSLSSGQVRKKINGRFQSSTASYTQTAFSFSFSFFPFLSASLKIDPRLASERQESVETPVECREHMCVILNRSVNKRGETGFSPLLLILSLPSLSVAVCLSITHTQSLARFII